MINQPFSMDYHSNLPLSTDFLTIRNKDIHIYMDVDTAVGSNGCGQRCEHCWFVNYENVYDKSFDIDEAEEIYFSLKSKGYNVYPRYTDSFSKNGEMFKHFKGARNKSFRESENLVFDNTMHYGEACTSGRPLLDENAEYLLDLAYANNYRTITVTFHGLLGGNLEIIDEYPINGVLKGKDFIKVLEVINDYNKRHNRDFRINVGITIGNHNKEKYMLMRYVKFFNQLKIQKLRFNNFSAHNVKFEELELSKDDRINFFNNIKWIHDNIKLSYQLGISEDFGDDGYEVLNYPENVGICKAGLQLFALIPIEKHKRKMLNHKEKIGIVTGCVNVFKPELGYLLKTDSGNYELEFNHIEIEKLQDKRLNNTYKNACFASEIRSEHK